MALWCCRRLRHAAATPFESRWHESAHQSQERRREGHRRAGESQEGDRGRRSAAPQGNRETAGRVLRDASRAGTHGLRARRPGLPVRRERDVPAGDHRRDGRQQRRPANRRPLGDPQLGLQRRLGTRQLRRSLLPGWSAWSSPAGVDMAAVRCAKGPGDRFGAAGSWWPRSLLDSAPTVRPSGCRVRTAAVTNPARVAVPPRADRQPKAET
jgi:hypothetical protein